MSEINPVRNRAMGAILTNALFRWETAVTLALTAILFLFVKDPFPWWQDWFWLIGGAIAEVALITSILTDPNAAREAVAREFEDKFDLREIKSPVSRERLQKAIDYRRNMMNLMQRHSGAMKLNLQQTVSDIDDWIGHMYNLAQHIDDFDSNKLVRDDRRDVPQQLDKARQRLSLEKDETVQRDIQTQIRTLEQQIANLDAAANAMKRAEIQLESTLSSLGTVYAQMSLIGTKEVDSARAQRLRLEIQDEVASLQDTIQALDEVQTQRLQLR